MTNLLKTNGVYGATVFRRVVFTREGALDRYKLILDYVYNDKGLNMNTSAVLTETEDDLVRIGFTREELEEIEIEFLENLS